MHWYMEAGKDMFMTHLVLSAWSRHDAQRRVQATEVDEPQQPDRLAEHSVRVVFHVQDGMVMNMTTAVAQPSFTWPASWYRRLRTAVSLGFLLMLLLALFVQSGLA